MNPDWRNTLEARGAVIDSGCVADFGDAAAELEAARSGSVLADLSHLGVLEFSGEDAQGFLQGQLTCDVNSLAAGSSSFGGYCSAQGRLLADFLLWRTPSGFRMLLARSITGAAGKRLAQYVLRAKVKIADSSDERVLLGAAGPGAGPALAAHFGEIPRRPHEVRRHPEGATMIALGEERFLVEVAPALAIEIQRALAKTLAFVGTPCWEWLDIRSGIPWISAPTQEQFVPQMANLDLLGGISFQKGCYPGQEIVARTRYLGRLKRRMFLANVAAQEIPAAGDPLYCDDLADQACGTVVAAQRSPAGGCDLLAVVSIESQAASSVRLKSPQGSALQFLKLPYQLD
ncbi:MAG: folate-binding protein YgfZ [Betaproteobacteria bacterium]|nr:folate-binding protein YgfZ [Betaproteobacteria bacterium]